MASRRNNIKRVSVIIAITVAIAVMALFPVTGCGGDDQETNPAATSTQAAPGAPFGPAVSISVPSGPANTIIDEN